MAQFDQELGHMSMLNEFLAESWVKFQEYFDAAADVGTAEDFYNIDEYSDVTRVTKPTIYISQVEIFFTHEVCVCVTATKMMSGRFFNSF